MRVKEAAARVKAVEEIETGEGEFTALVSVFDTKDTYGDVIRYGAFTKSLAEIEASGDPLPVIWSHDWADPFSHIGEVVKAEETVEGLVVTGRIDLDNPTGRQVYRLLKGRRITQFSFAYDILDGDFKEDDEFGEYFELRELKLHEVGPCLVGVNQETELLDVKSRALAAGVKAGRVLSQKNFEAVVAARDALDSVIASAAPEDEGKAVGQGEPEPASGPGPNDDHDPALVAGSVKSEEGMGAATRRARTLVTMINNCV